MYKIYPSLLRDGWFMIRREGSNRYYPESSNQIAYFQDVISAQRKINELQDD